MVELFVKSGDAVLNIDILPPRNLEQFPYWSNVDILDVETLKSTISDFSPDIIYHLAARTDLDGESLDEYQANIRGVLNIIQSVSGLKNLRRIIFASSRLVFKLGHNPINDFDYCPTTAYGESKVLGEKLIFKYRNLIPCSWVIVRPTSIWGPWFDVPYKSFFLAIRAGRYFHPKGHRILKSFGYVGNTVHQLKVIGEAESKYVNSRVFMLGDYCPINVKEFSSSISKEFSARSVRSIPILFMRIAALIGDCCKYSGLIKHPPLTTFRLNNLVTNMIFDFEELRKVVGSLPFSEVEGIKNTCNWLGLKRD